MASDTRLDETDRALQVLIHERCPCGHLKQRHRKPDEGIDGALFGPCRDCVCQGLIGLASGQEWCVHCDGEGILGPAPEDICRACDGTGIAQSEVSNG